MTSITNFETIEQYNPDIDYNLPKEIMIESTDLNLSKILNKYQFYRKSHIFEMARYQNERLIITSSFENDGFINKPMLHFYKIVMFKKSKLTTDIVKSIRLNFKFFDKANLNWLKWDAKHYYGEDDQIHNTKYFIGCLSKTYNLQDSYFTNKGFPVYNIKTYQNGDYLRYLGNQYEKVLQQNCSIIFQYDEYNL